MGEKLYMHVVYPSLGTRPPPLPDLIPKRGEKQRKCGLKNALHTLHGDFRRSRYQKTNL